MAGVRNSLADAMRRARAEGRRLVAPLVGFPGLSLTGCTIKLAQQNFGEHFRVIQRVAELVAPDIIFPLMDLAVEANAVGRYTVFPRAESPVVMKDSFSPDNLARLEQVNIAFDARLLGYVETQKLMRIGLPDSMIQGAYVTGPYSLAALIMGAEEAAMATMLQPDDLHALCRVAAGKVLDYARLLIAAGAQVICILEPTAVMLGPGQFAEFSAGYVRLIVEYCNSNGVATIYHTCGNTMRLVGKMAEAGVQAVSLDSVEAGVDLPAVAAAAPQDVVIMGNISPTGALLTGTPQAVEAEVGELLERMAFYPNYVLSTGCDLPQETPLDNIRAFMRTGRRYRLNPFSHPP